MLRIPFNDFILTFETEAVKKSLECGTSRCLRPISDSLIILCKRKTWDPRETQLLFHGASYYLQQVSKLKIDYSPTKKHTVPWTSGTTHSNWPVLPFREMWSLPEELVNGGRALTLNSQNISRPELHPLSIPHVNTSCSMKIISKTFYIASCFQESKMLTRRCKINQTSYFDQIIFFSQMNITEHSLFMRYYLKNEAL